MIGGGLWHPEGPALSALRNDIDRHPQRLKGVLLNDQMRKEFLNGARNKQEKVVKAFVESPMNAESALKTKPKVSTRSCFEDVPLDTQVPLLSIWKAVYSTDPVFKTTNGTQIADVCNSTGNYKQLLQEG